MKKNLIITLLFLFNFTFANANADSNYVSDYTLIDCVNGNNDTGVAFDNSKPYATLKVGIENTINYINSNVNKIGNEQSSSGIVFNIKVNCSFNDILNPSINLNYNGVSFNNEIIIEGIGDNSLIFKDISFYLSYSSGNITFKNAIFLNDNKPYFYDQMNIPGQTVFAGGTHPYSNGIKIIDSYIKLKNSNNIGNNMNYESYHYYYYNSLYKDSLYNYTNKQMIENSIIDIDVFNDFTFRLPVSVKNSKINFTNSGSNSNYNITFLEDGNISTSTNLNYSVFTSNVIDFGGNNFVTENTTNIAFLNNKFVNFNNFNFGGSSVFINNFIDNNQSINISSFHNLYNNVFKSGFTDTYDIFNHRKNYSSNNIGNTGIGWIYKRIRANKYFNIDINSAGLYKEITGQDLPNGLSDIYVIFNY